MKWTPCIAIAGIVILDVVAMIKGVDGVVLSAGIAAIAGIGGYEVKMLRDKMKGGK